MLYDDANEFFGWPDRPQVFEPAGAGARAYADEVERKIGAELRRQFPNLTVEAGVLAADPNSDSTEAPIAIVCEFRNGATEEALKQSHRLAWNFSRTALLITLEPDRLLAWSCWLDPQQKDESPQVRELRELPEDARVARSTPCNPAPAISSTGSASLRAITLNSNRRSFPATAVLTFCCWRI